MRVGRVGTGQSYGMKEDYMSFGVTWRTWELREKGKQSRVQMKVLEGEALFREDLWATQNLRKVALSHIKKLGM